MLKSTNTIIRTALNADPSIDPKLAEYVISVLEGKQEPQTNPVDRVLSRRQVAELIGKSVKSVDIYGRRGIFRRITLGGNRSLGYSEQSVRAALSAGIREVA